MRVSLTPHWEKFIKEKLEGGRYENASEILGQALRMLEERDEQYQAQLERLRCDIEEGRKGHPLEFNADSIKEEARLKRSAN